MDSKRILIAGGCGFIGSSLAIRLKIRYPHYQIISIDNLKRRGSELNVLRLLNHDIQFLHGDLRNIEDLRLTEKIDCIIDAAAEPSILGGLNSPLDYLINTNLHGTIHALDLAIQHEADFIFLSTSRIYPIQKLQSVQYSETADRFNLNEIQTIQGITKVGISENFPLDGYRSFYGTTKLASELMIEEYKVYKGLNYVINRCSIIAGPYQMGKIDQGVLAFWMFQHYFKKDLSYIGFGGEGKQVRDALHIDDLINLIDYQLHNLPLVNGEIFNIGGGLASNSSLKEMSSICHEITGNKVIYNKIAENRLGDIPLYITDNSKICKKTGWKSEKKIFDILTDIYTWIHQDEQQLKPYFK